MRHSKTSTSALKHIRCAHIRCGIPKQAQVHSDKLDMHTLDLTLQSVRKCAQTAEKVLATAVPKVQSRQAYSSAKAVKDMSMHELTAIQQTMASNLHVHQFLSMPLTFCSIA
eukprot:1161797-Pelagomonas_calceolata.AAC.2